MSDLRFSSGAASAKRQAKRVVGATILALSMLVAPERAPAQSAGKTVADWWEAAYLQNARCGYVHTKIDELDQGGVKVIRSAIEFRLNVKRNNDVIQLAMDSGTFEFPDGKVFGTFMRQFQGRSQVVEITGVVDGSQITLTRNKTQPISPAPWDPQVLGVYKQKTLFQDQKIKTGDAFSYKSFEPTINLVANTLVNVKDYEDVELFAGKQKKRLLRVEAKAEKIGTFQLPPYTAWLDESLLPLRAEFEVPGIGKVVLYQTTKAFASAPASAAPPLDVGISHFVRLSRKIVRPHETAAAVYRITIKDGDDVASAFARDGRQEVKNIKGNTLELHVHADRGGDAAEKPSAEFTQSSYFITSDDAKVQELARQAVVAEKEPWKKALKIEKWVNAHMRVTNREGLAPADRVARTLEGDCTEFAMLTAAMCRAEGIPSRTAMGLIYADVRTGPVFAFHMWTEVWIDGRWRALDATLGQGGIGAVHLKISDQSWHDDRALTPLLPVARVLGKLAIEVVRVEGR
jgi:transglutaminase-like putative cysteine protease